MGHEADLHGSQQEVALRQRLESPLGSGWHRRVAAEHGKAWSAQRRPGLSAGSDVTY